MFSGVVEDNAGGMPRPRVQPADPVPHIDAVDAAHALDRPLMHCDHHGIAMAQQQRHGASLHAWAPFGHHKLAAFDIAFGLVQQQHQLP